MPSKLVVKKSEITGTGLFAAEPIKKGDVVMLWSIDAYLISESQYNTLQEQGDELIIATGARYVGDRFLFTDERPRFENHINHSFTPNILYHCGVCFALADISTGEELTVNYRYILSEEDSESFTDKKTGKIVTGTSSIKCLKETTEQLCNLLKCV